MFAQRRAMAWVGRAVAVLAVAVWGSAAPGQAPRAVSSSAPADGWFVGERGFESVRLAFDRDVEVAPGSARLVDATTGLDVASDASYDAASRTLTVTALTPVFTGRVLLIVGDGVRGLDGSALDGESGDPNAPAFPTGDGLEGGSVVLLARALVGDVDRNGVVDDGDEMILLGALGSALGDADFDARADLNRDGLVDALDLGVLLQGAGGSLAMGDGTPPGVIATVPADGETILSNLRDFEVFFDEPVLAGSLRADAAVAVSDSGVSRSASQVAVAADGLSAVFRFVPELAQCDGYRVQFDPSFVDGSGEVASSVSSASVSGVTPPQTPAAFASVALTSSGAVEVSGVASGASSLAVVGPGGVNEVAVDGPTGAFVRSIDLAPNRVNRLFVTAYSSCGIPSAPRTVEVIQDQTPPTLGVDFPMDGANIQSPTTDVAGRVGDLLSGFDGLTVTVNGAPASVDIGIGTNGTFFMPAVALSESGATPIEVRATDAAGNTSVQTISVTRRAIPGNAPLIEIVGGNAQESRIETTLADPIRVRITRPDGAPLASKLVTFRVSRSNGLLGADASAVDQRVVQVRADSEGFAEVFWRLGSDAGRGNNRVEVTSRDVAGTTIFCASATPGPARQINIGANNNQRGEIGAPIARPLQAWVSDSCNGIPDIPVTFEVVRGDGLVNGSPIATVVTGPTGHAEVDFALGTTPGNNVVRASFPDNPTGPAEFVVFGVERDPSMPTRFSGVVLDNASQPVQGAECVLIINHVEVGVTESDLNGRFEFVGFDGAGEGHLFVDGTVAFRVGGADGEDVDPLTYPSLEYEIVVVPNAENALGMPVLLPRYDPANFRFYSTSEPTVLELLGVEGLRMIIEPGSMTMPDGTPAEDGELLALNQVHHDDVPMPMPDGAAPPFAWTVYPPGAHFDPPIRIEYPNMSGLAPGSIAYMLSFDHETSRFEIVASASVTEDGSTIVTDPGAGLTVSGWGCNCPPYSVTGDCEVCETECVESGSLSGGDVQVSRDEVIVGDFLTFTAAGVSDSGGGQEEMCSDGSGRSLPVSPVSPSYSYELSTPSGGMSGSGDIAGVTAEEPGVYTATFFARADRDCAPSQITVGSASATARPIEIVMFEYLNGCARRGDSVSKADFLIVTDPPGRDDLVSVSPSTYSSVGSFTVTASAMGAESRTAEVNVIDPMLVTSITPREYNFSNLARLIRAGGELIPPQFPCQITPPGGNLTAGFSIELFDDCCNGTPTDLSRLKGTFSTSLGSFECSLPFLGVPYVASINADLVGGGAFSLSIDSSETCEMGDNDVCGTVMVSASLGGGVSAVFGPDVASVSGRVIGRASGSGSFCSESGGKAQICFNGATAVGTVTLVTVFTSSFSVDLPITPVCSDEVTF